MLHHPLAPELRAALRPFVDAETLDAAIASVLTVPRVRHAPAVLVNAQRLIALSRELELAVRRHHDCMACGQPLVKGDSERDALCIPCEEVATSAPVSYGQNWLHCAPSERRGATAPGGAFPGSPVRESRAPASPQGDAAP